MAIGDWRFKDLLLPEEKKALLDYYRIRLGEHPCDGAAFGAITLRLKFILDHF